MGTPLEQLREAVAALPPPPRTMVSYLEKVRAGAYMVVDDDVETLKAAGCSEDEIFEHTVAAAVGEGLRRLDAGLRALA